MSIQLVTFVVRLAAEAEEGPNHLLSYGIGAIAFGILASLMLGLLAFGRGRDHS